MAAPRLPFLYPSLIRAVRSCKPRPKPKPFRPTATTPRTGFHTSRPCGQQTFHRRYGPAAGESNLPPPARPKEESGHLPGAAQKDTSSPEKPQSSAATSSEESRPVTEMSPLEKPTSETASSHTQSSDSLAEADELLEETEPAEAAAVDFTPAQFYYEDRAEQQAHPPPNLNEKNPLEDVLHMPEPATYMTPSGVPPADSQKPPHLSPSPYVHHFDTWTLVRDLSNGGFSQDQSVTIMKAIRNILQSNLDLARQSLTSKSDVENESYLFKAACSELQSSLQTARNSEVQQQRASRTHLEHEADILSQRLNQELAGMKDDIKGMFNDHKMATRELQRSIDTSVQEINYKITVSLNSDGKSEIESLRWVLTRRAALAVGISAFMIICFLRYYSYRMAAESHKAKEAAAAKEIAESRPREAHPVQPEVPFHDVIIPEAIVSESLG
ncbi:hypothetical protein ASPZODRAFT_135845 [Penicilliopsis zonata CBS 506.65]|uniref:MOZ protein represents a chromatin-associated acetyltransferase n=1 Tax=Penicilliopsis zonata CBS 506.65 TaxID=1073090 RepID=A0A1L9S9L6_9EURO|nr:hypothetical protein ASPZODRAFT_135845 [Penicilliopsis zonata CBS 506.65]OJJ43819.1 hypothetical protein ASPZODRAFT_135845 [Penicilliopsis zonata CBS 506.65]